MKPARIRILIVEENAAVRRELFEFLSADDLLCVAGCFCTCEEWQKAGTDAEIAVLGLSGNDGENRKNLWRLKRADIPVIALTRPNTDEEQYGDLVSARLSLSRSAEDAAFRVRNLYPRLKYQIRNVRLARTAEKSGVRGTWRVFPTELTVPVKTQGACTFRDTDIKLIAIGASAGGTQALLELIPALPPDMPAIALVQHMPESFVALFARHLQAKSRLRVCLAEGGEKAERGTVYLTALDRHLTVVQRCGDMYFECTDGEGNTGIRPSVDRLFSSAASLGREAVGILLTGMGSDGAKGLLKMRIAGAYTIGQDEKTCVVYGMPGAARRLGAVECELPLGQIPAALLRQVFPNERSQNDGGS